MPATNSKKLDFTTRPTIWRRASIREISVDVASRTKTLRVLLSLRIDSPRTKKTGRRAEANTPS